MAIQLYMDHNVPRAITDGLRARGVKVITVFEDGASESDDTELLDRVVDLGRVLFTRDIIYCKKQQNDKEVAHLSKALSMLTNCAFQSELAFATWKALQKRANLKTSKITYNFYRYNDKN